MTVPGVGSISALTLTAAVDDPTRFKRSRTVGAHFGLSPRRYQSGEHDDQRQRTVTSVLHFMRRAMRCSCEVWRNRKLSLGECV
ncbi:transposase [Phaeobacter sp. C3_T13_0]|uniref:transposase n=1 Tax=Phaeobacter cretensis TaxID=3342641 RepID=UPI0039BCFC1A